MSLSNYNEKGAREWSTFSAVRGDKVSREVYRVKVPVKSEVKLKHGTVVPVRKYPQPHFVPKAAH